MMSQFAKYDRDIRAMARHFASKIEDDLVQIGRLAFLETEAEWDQTGSLWKLAKQRVLGAMINHMTRKESRAFRELSCDGLDDVRVTSDRLSPEDICAARERLRGLSEEEMRIFVEYVTNNVTMRELATKRGVSKSKVHRVLEDLRDSA